MKLVCTILHVYNASRYIRTMCHACLRTQSCALPWKLRTPDRVLNFRRPLSSRDQNIVQSICTVEAHLRHFAPSYPAEHLINAQGHRSLIERQAASEDVQIKGISLLGTATRETSHPQAVRDFLNSVNSGESFDLLKWVDMLHLCGEKMVMTSPRQRQQLADDVLEAFHLSGLKQPFLEMEFVWLKCSYDNEHFVDVKQHLHKLLSENKTTINLSLGEILVMHACQRADVESAKALLRFMKQNRIKTNVLLSAHLLFALIKAGQEDEVKRLISTVKQRGFQIRANFLCYAAYAYAQLGQYERFGRMVLLADKVGSPFFTMHLLWSYYYFVINGHKEQAAQLLKLLRRDVIPRRYMRVRILTQLYHRGHKVEMHSVYKCFETEEEGRMTYSQLLFSVRAPAADVIKHMLTESHTATNLMPFIVSRKYADIAYSLEVIKELERVNRASQRHAKSKQCRSHRPLRKFFRSTKDNDELYEAFAAVYHFKHYTDATLPIAPCRAAVAILLERHETHDVIIHRLGEIGVKDAEKYIWGQYLETGQLDECRKNREFYALRMDEREFHAALAEACHKTNQRAVGEFLVEVSLCADRPAEFLQSLTAFVRTGAVPHGEHFASFMLYHHSVLSKQGLDDSADNTSSKHQESTSSKT